MKGTKNVVETAIKNTANNGGICKLGKVLILGNAVLTLGLTVYTIVNGVKVRRIYKKINNNFKLMLNSLYSEQNTNSKKTKNKRV